MKTNRVIQIGFKDMKEEKPTGIGEVIFIVVDVSNKMKTYFGTFLQWSDEHKYYMFDCAEVEEYFPLGKRTGISHHTTIHRILHVDSSENQVFWFSAYRMELKFHATHPT